MSSFVEQKTGTNGQSSCFCCLQILRVNTKREWKQTPTPCNKLVREGDNFKGLSGPMTSVYSYGYRKCITASWKRVVFYGKPKDPHSAFWRWLKLLSSQMLAISHGEEAYRGAKGCGGCPWHFEVCGPWGVGHTSAL